MSETRTPSEQDAVGIAVLLRTFVERERAIRDGERGKGGQHVGYSPQISPSVLRELEWMLKNGAEVGDAALAQARAQGQQDERAKGCETCGARGFGGQNGAYYRKCLEHSLPCEDLGERCGKWEPLPGEGRKETTDGK